MNITVHVHIQGDTVWVTLYRGDALCQPPEPPAT